MDALGPFWFTGSHVCQGVAEDVNKPSGDWELFFNLSNGLGTNPSPFSRRPEVLGSITPSGMSICNSLGVAVPIFGIGKLSSS